MCVLLSGRKTLFLWHVDGIKVFSTEIDFRFMTFYGVRERWKCDTMKSRKIVSYPADITYILCGTVEMASFFNATRLQISANPIYFSTLISLYWILSWDFTSWRQTKNVEDETSEILCRNTKIEFSGKAEKFFLLLHSRLPFSILSLVVSVTRHYSSVSFICFITIPNIECCNRCLRSPLLLTSPPINRYFNKFARSFWSKD